jgi:hypothetical protein
MEDVGSFWPFGQFSIHLAYFMAIWYIFPPFGTFYMVWYVVPRKIWQPRCLLLSRRGHETLRRQHSTERIVDLPRMAANFDTKKYMHNIFGTQPT